MRTSEQTNEISTALARAQGKLSPASKDSANPFYKSKYADLATVMEAAREPLAANGLSVTQIPRQTPNGEWVLVTRLSHSSGQWIEGEFPLYYKDHTQQAIGSSVSYARRYSLSAMVGIVQDDDDGEASVGRKNEIQNQNTQQSNKPPIQRDFKKEVVTPSPTPKNQTEAKITGPKGQPGVQYHTPSEAQLKRLYAITKSNGWTEKQVKELIFTSYGKDTSRDLNSLEYQELCNYIESSPPPGLASLPKEDDLVL